MKSIKTARACPLGLKKNGRRVSVKETAVAGDDSSKGIVLHSAGFS